MNAKSSNERARLHRENAQKSGHTEIKMIARSNQDKEEIEKLKYNQLVRFIGQQPENEQLSPSVREAVHGAITLQGSPQYITPHGAIGQVINTLLENGMTAQVVPVVRIYSACYPTSLAYVLKSLPARVMNYLCREADARAVTDWAAYNPDWADHISGSVLNGTFDDVLYQMRTAVGTMSFNPTVLSMLRRLKEDAVNVNPESLKQASQILDKAPETLVQSPRQWDEDCNALRAFIMYFLQCDLEQRYGEMEFPDKTYHVPFYAWEREAAGMPATGVVTFKEDSVLAGEYDYGLCIGWRFDAWDKFFYQAALGAVFLLNPRTGPHGTVKTSTLEAAVAIRYAEQMLDKYLPYTPRKRVESPVGGDNSFSRAYLALGDVPDDVLRQVRDVFGSFGSITDPEKFYSMTSPWLSPENARLLCSDFSYS
ncbi:MULTISPECIES: hypothetical protein [Enterobacteriaceae]|nr:MULTISPECIES: hypothetical protein [Enterobacteriaceae]MCM7986511.1 hypothetical protein [Enterobacter hormaechei]MCM8207675.1 hypothetical protein [Enterobacter hormaechei]MCM8236797.1 hypothetical protein [Enterobacter hormaechei]MDF3634949.1 hypothetical protein [Enterobacter hormaechei]OOB86022.1 hypothetical protein BZY71_16330 [Leclercia adecarboxylata]